MTPIDKIYQDSIRILRMYSKPYCTYHDENHTKYVFKKCKHIGQKEGISESDLYLVQVAALFHDLAYTKSPNNHERKSYQMAAPFLKAYGFSASDMKKIEGMIMATKIPQKPKTHLEQIIADADLIYLGTTDFKRQSHNLHIEMKHFNPKLTQRKWDDIQVLFIENHHYHTAFCKRYYTNRKLRNLERLKATM